MDTQLIDRILAEKEGYSATFIEVLQPAHWVFRTPQGKCSPYANEAQCWDQVPNYTDDLNALARVEAKLSPPEWLIYSILLQPHIEVLHDQNVGFIGHGLTNNVPKSRTVSATVVHLTLSCAVRARCLAEALSGIDRSQWDAFWGSEHPQKETSCQ